MAISNIAKRQNRSEFGVAKNLERLKSSAEGSILAETTAMIHEAILKLQSKSSKEGLVTMKEIAVQILEE